MFTLSYAKKIYNKLLRKKANMVLKAVILWMGQDLHLGDSLISRFVQGLRLYPF